MRNYALALATSAAATISAAVAAVARSAATDGVDQTTGWALGIIAGGSAVFLWFWKQYRNQENDLAGQRRQADDRLLEQNEELEAEVRELQDEVRTLYRQLLNERRPDG